MVFLFWSILWAFFGTFLNISACQSHFFMIKIKSRFYDNFSSSLKLVRELARTGAHQPSDKTWQLRVFAISGGILIESQDLLSAFLTIFNALEIGDI